MTELQQMVLDTNLRNSLNNLNGHFKAIAALPEFKARMGNIRQGKKQILPASLQGETSKQEKVINAKAEAAKKK